MGDGCWLAVSGIIFFILMEENPYGEMDRSSVGVT
jgi:hypothetical protein